MVELVIFYATLCHISSSEVLDLLMMLDEVVNVYDNDMDESIIKDNLEWALTSSHSTVKISNTRNHQPHKCSAC